MIGDGSMVFELLLLSLTLVDELVTAVIVHKRSGAGFRAR